MPVCDGYKMSQDTQGQYASCSCSFLGVLHFSFLNHHLSKLLLLLLLSHVSHVQLFATPWTAASQAPPSMGFSRQEYWSEVPLPSPHLSRIHVNTVSVIPLTENLVHHVDVWHEPTEFCKAIVLQLRNKQIFKNQVHFPQVNKLLFVFITSKFHF